MGPELTPKGVSLPPEDLTADVRLFVVGSPRLDPRDVLTGCELWSDLVGVTCTVVNAVDEANVRVHASFAPCEPLEGEELPILASAYSSGDILVETRCFGGEDGRHKLATVMAHEIGHLFGVWDHVPDHCRGEHLTHSETGKGVCGNAVMNAVYGPDMPGPNHVDALAFDLRFRFASILSGGEPSAEHSCHVLDRSR